jgi:hypothetical protein
MSAEVIVNLIGLAADVIGGISKRIDDDELKTVISDQKIQQLLLEIHKSSLSLITKVKKNDEEIDNEVSNK